jgi:ring-1,2-phenylacetyl-CoA epoxidase subunit PaaD
MMTTPIYDKAFILKLLDEVQDPEIPVISIKELGVVRDVVISENGVEIILSPTYSGCPAMKQMEEDVKKKLEDHGITNIKITLQYSPAWTTDWIGESAKEKLRLYGIAPPEHSSISKAELMGKSKSIKCPLCKSENTIMISQFGSTACKALYKCSDCLEPFDYFKCI